jgi:hypothetical protein
MKDLLTALARTGVGAAKFVLRLAITFMVLTP